MKNNNFLSLGLLLCCLLTVMCTRKTEVEEEDLCINPEKINLEAPCYLIYAPVCGCDAKTYSNDCVAETNGVLNWTEGECP